MYDENPGRAQAGAPPRPARGTGNGRAASTVTTKKNSTTTNTSAGIIGTSTSATPSSGKALPLRCLGSLGLQTTGGDKKNSKKKRYHTCLWIWQDLCMSCIAEKNNARTRFFENMNLSLFAMSVPCSGRGGRFFAHVLANIDIFDLLEAFKRSRLTL